MPKAIWNGAVIAQTEKFETVEGNIYFPPGASEASNLAGGTLGANPHRLIHEIAHAEQCKSPLTYAEMWFGQLGSVFISRIMQGDWPSDTEIHDRQPMEIEADRKADDVMSKLP